MTNESGHSRRDFIKSSAVAAAGTAALAEHRFAVLGHAAPDAPIKVGVIGCGGRGTGAVLNVLQASTKVVYPKTGYHTEDVAEGAATSASGVEIVALADLFPDRLAECRAQLTKLGVEVKDDACFTGFDAYEKVLAREDVNYVILACPPHFRPKHFKAAVEAGKNVFMEKPIAVDGTGVRTVLEAGELATQKGLAVVAGTQRRHEERFVQTMEKLHDGAVGDIHTCRAYWNGGRIWVVERQEGWSDLEWQLRNWCYNIWIAGGQNVEQHIHSLDVANWALGAHPISARGMGGRQVHDSELYGNAYDHMAVEYEYPDGVRMFSQCRQMDNCENMVATHVEGSEGRADCQGMIWGPDGKGTWRYRNRDAPNPYEQEHLDLIQSIKSAEDAWSAIITDMTDIERAFAGIGNMFPPAA